MDAIKRATETLVEFLRHEDQRVLALKGPWGVGKSLFVRNFIAENRERLPPFVAFASVFGLRSLAEVRRREDFVLVCFISAAASIVASKAEDFAPAGP
jgi:ATP-dependent Lon protease